MPTAIKIRSLDSVLPALVKLSTAQAAFLGKYLVADQQNPASAAAAALFAYPNCANPSVLACQILRRRCVKNIVSQFFGKSDLQVALETMYTLIKRSRRKRNGALVNQQVLVPAWTRVARALEALAAKEEKA